MGETWWWLGIRTRGPFRGILRFWGVSQKGDAFPIHILQRATGTHSVPAPSSRCCLLGGAKAGSRTGRERAPSLPSPS